MKVKEKLIGTYQVDDMRNFLLKWLANFIHLVDVEVLLLILLISNMIVTDEHNYSHITNAETRDIIVVDYELKCLYTKLYSVLRNIEDTITQGCFLHGTFNNANGRQLQLFVLLSGFHIIINSAHAWAL
jgi:hypothetical protein